MPKILSFSYLKTHRKDVFFVAFIAVMTIILSSQRALMFRDFLNVDGNPCYELMAARGSGIVINFCIALLLLLMSRPLVTQIRMSQLSRLLPIDHHVEYHKAIAMLFFAAAIIHTVAHIYNIEKNFKEDNFETFVKINNMTFEQDDLANLTHAEWLFTTLPKINGAFPGLANPTGFLMVIICLIIGIGAHPKIRLKGHFEIFYWTHISYSLLIVLMILHCDQTIWWIFLPLAIFLAGKFSMLRRFVNGTGRTYAVSGTILPSQVTQLTIRRKENFPFHCGDWIFINIPAISKFEFHPFTISSAPEQNDVFTLHIRSVGSWTKQLHAYFKEEERLLRLESKIKGPSQNDVYKKSLKER